ncbi:Helix-turn-helix domain-containing protein [Thermomonospora echinospora]|uniref:Helix-turn-helix domain-containing protein n=1 Tax=Thermomonospora echinospora TaxID=1992 RepID=A0A1H5TCI0_9ACTN|nr:helix-turn-helix transcriptional regulator [Thermomonospora echinospora]SEF60473.1 Helix-turn-helix domain-containing protein [Thermomonospora echinospora]
MGGQGRPRGPAGGTAPPRWPGPTAARLLVGARLRRLREDAGVTCEDAGRAIRGSHSKISRLELGRTGVKIRDLADLLTRYGLADEAERAELFALAHHANEPPWWGRYADVVPSWFEHYLGLEQAASLVRCYEGQFVPGLLQTREYARATIRLGHPDEPPSRIERRVELRMARQALLHRPGAPRLWAVIDEAALRRRPGSAATMRAQLAHLIAMTELPHVTVQVVPFSGSGHAAVGGPITILRFAERRLPDLVYLEQLTSALYPDRPADRNHYTMVMHRLAVEAEPPEASVPILRRVLVET